MTAIRPGRHTKLAGVRAPWASRKARIEQKRLFPGAARASRSSGGPAALEAYLTLGAINGKAGLTLVEREVVQMLGPGDHCRGALGLATGSWQPLDVATTPVFQLLRMTSPLSWMPIAVMTFGLGDRAIDVLLAFAAVWPIALSTAAGVRALDRRWLLLGRSLAATRTETLLHVVLPGVTGHVLTGIRLAIGISWIVLVPCEMLGVSSGLGYLILNTRDALAYSDLMAVVLVIGIIGFALDTVARGLLWVWGSR